MEICIASGGIQSTEDELIVVNLFEGVEKPGGATGTVDQALSGAIREVIAERATKLAETAADRGGPGIAWTPLEVDQGEVYRRYRFVEVSMDREARTATVTVTVNGANHVLILNLEWSPETTLQAEDRCHRPGQTREVHVHYLLSSQTVDEQMWDLVDQKWAAQRAVQDREAQHKSVEAILAEAPRELTTCGHDRDTEERTRDAVAPTDDDDRAVQSAEAADGHRVRGCVVGRIIGRHQNAVVADVHGDGGHIEGRGSTRQAVVPPL